MVMPSPESDEGLLPVAALTSRSISVTYVCTHQNMVGLIDILIKIYQIKFSDFSFFNFGIFVNVFVIYIYRYKLFSEMFVHFFLGKGNNYISKNYF